MSDLPQLLNAALDARAEMLDERYESALRLFNGFVEGIPEVVVDLYGRTLVVHDYTPSGSGDEPLVRRCVELVTARLPGITCAVRKIREADSPELRNGVLITGSEKALTRRVRENGVWYAVALTMNRDASLYLDTRELRSWARTTLGGKRVLNTFAYTGSLGVAARAGGAEVVHTDANRRFLNVAKDSYTLNGFPIRRSDFLIGDFFEIVSRLKREGARFDCVLLDPPFFSVTSKGRVDLETSLERLINKVRPLVAHDGRLVVVNNALFVSGAEFVDALQAMSTDGYLSIEDRIPVPPDCAGFPSTRRLDLPVDPTPFNHSTKIAVLRVRRKDERR